MQIDVVTLDDDLDALVTQINQAVWDEANDMSAYETGALRAYLARADTLFVTCFEGGW